MESLPVQLVVFDIAGTTVRDDDFVGQAFINAFQKNGFAITREDAHPYMGVKKIVAVGMMLEKLDANASRESVERIHNDFVNEMLDFYEYDPRVKPFGNTEMVFEKLKARGVTIALNTGFPKVIADTIVNRFQWKDKGLVDDYIASDEVENGRPAATMIEQLMERAGVSNPAAVAKIGDTYIDIEEGRNAGCAYNIAVLTGSGKQEELSAYHPTHIIGDLAEVLDILK